MFRLSRIRENRDLTPIVFAGLVSLAAAGKMQTRHVFVHVRSAVAHSAADSLTVLVNVDSEQPLAGEQEETLRAFLTYVPVDARVRIGGIGTFSGRAPLAPGGLPGFTGPFPSTSLDKGVCGCQVQPGS